MSSSRVQSVRGMREAMPGMASKISEIQERVLQTIRSYAYDEIQISLLEYTELFARGVGEATDIVEKEMYSLEDRDGVSLSLRPEGTAGCVRALEENGLLYNQTQKVFYAGPMFRYEKPQKGRYRQFNQIGVEAYGFSGPDIDLELILLARDIWEGLGLTEVLTLEINNLGSLEARKKYRLALVEFLQPNKAALDEDSQRRLQTNPLRILDTKNEKTKLILEKAPKLEDFLDSESKERFSRLCALLTEQGQDYVINPFLVRGLDYYTDCVFEWKANNVGAQDTICAGGRYDGLVERLGGRQTPAIGFAIGLERMILALEALEQTQESRVSVDVYVSFLEESLLGKAMNIADRIRKSDNGLRVRVHMGGGNFKKQLKRADAVGAKWAVLIGDEEVKQNIVTLKNMRDSEDGQVGLPIEGAIKKIMSDNS